MINGNVKTTITDKYAIMFNMVTGVEMLTGIKGHEDPFVLEMPSLMDIGVMGTCPNRCSFCYQGDKQQPNMSINDYKRLIYSVKDSVNQVALGGRGNPDEHPAIYEMLAYARQCNIIPNYTTAGNNFTPAKAEMSKMTGVTAVSMYFQDYTFSALKMLMDAGVKTNIHWIVSSETLPIILKLVRDGVDVFGGRLDMDRLNAIVFLMFKPCGRGADHPELIVPDEGIKEFAEAMRSHKGPWKIGLDSCMVGRIAGVVGLTEQEQVFTDACEGSRASVYITPDMKLLPCSFGQTIVDGVSLNTNTFKEAWDSKLFREFRTVLEFTPHVCPWLKWEERQNVARNCGCDTPIGPQSTDVNQRFFQPN